MQTLEAVQRLLEELKTAGTPLPAIIQAIAPACLGWPYVFGAWGEQCTPANRGKRAREDHPTIRSACPALSGTGGCSGCKWGIGVRMYDCRGFTAWLVRSVGLEMIGGGATGQWNDARNWAQKGEIGDMPDAVCCVFRRVNGKMEHTGMHIGGGRVIHCSRGVQEGTTSSGWTHYAIPRGLYPEEEIPVETVRRTLRKGSQGADVREMQEALISWGHDPGEADGVFGTRTQAALKGFQRAQGLTPDGVCGPKTWAALTQPVATYTVRAEGVTFAQYQRILEICPLAEAELERGSDQWRQA